MDRSCDGQVKVDCTRLVCTLPGTHLTRPATCGPPPPALPGPAQVVWAHNSHLGDARHTDMGWRRGQHNLGQLVRQVCVCGLRGVG